MSDDKVPPVTPARSRNMAAIRRRDTKPEMAVRSFLHRSGLRYRVDVADLPGRPDIVLRRWNAAVYVHGCFWHRHEGCRYATMPRANVEFWTRKFERNVERDRQSIADIREAGWRVAVVWECGLHRTVHDQTLEDLKVWITGENSRQFTSGVPFEAAK